MASLVTRRQSLGQTPRITIPPRHLSKDEAPQYDTGSPTQEVVGHISPPSTPPVSGSLSPELQPNTPPVIPSGQQSVYKIGKYLLVEQLDSNIYKAVDIHTNQDKICKVSTVRNLLFGFKILKHDGQTTTEDLKGVKHGFYSVIISMSLERYL